MKSIRTSLVCLFSIISMSQNLAAHPGDNSSYLQLGVGTKFQVTKAINFPPRERSFTLGAERDASLKHCLLQLMPGTKADSLNEQYDIEIPEGDTLTITKMQTPSGISSGMKHLAEHGDLVVETSRGTSLTFFCAEVKNPGDGNFLARELRIGEVKPLIEEYLQVELARPIPINFEIESDNSEVYFQDI